MLDSSEQLTRDKVSPGPASQADEGVRPDLAQATSGTCLTAVAADQSLACLQIQQAGWHLDPKWSLSRCLASQQESTDWQRSPHIQDAASVDLASAIMDGPCIPMLIGIEVGRAGPPRSCLRAVRMVC